MDKVEQRRQKLVEIKKLRIPVPYQVEMDIEKDSPSSAARQWSWWAHVWSRPSASTWDPMLSGNLAKAQENWDTSRAFVDTRLEAAAEREQAQKAQQAEEEAKRKAKKAEESAALDAQLRSSFLATPGATEEDWERSRDRVREDHLMREAGRADDEARKRVRSVIARTF